MQSLWCRILNLKGNITREIYHNKGSIENWDVVLQGRNK